MCTSGELAGSKFELRDEALFLGLDAKKRIRVSTDPKDLAERYARISVKDGKYKLEAIEGAPPITVDGGAVSAIISLDRLHVISLGPKGEFVFRKSAGTPASTPAVAATPEAKAPAPGAAAPASPPPPAAKPPAPAAPNLPAGTMIDAGAFDAIPALGRKPGGAPAAPPQAPSPPNAPQVPMGTMIDAGGFGDITDPRLKRPAAPATPAPPPPAAPPPSVPLGTMIDVGGLPEITDPRKRISNATTAPMSPAVPPPAATPPPAPTPPRPANSELPTAFIAGLAPTDEFSPYELVTVLPGVGAQTYRLKFGENVVGRGEAADIQVPDAQMGMSRRHAIVRVLPDKIELVDLKGQNGTYVNGQRIETAVINPGTSFHLGVIKFGLKRR